MSTYNTEDQSNNTNQDKTLGESQADGKDPTSYNKALIVLLEDKYQEVWSGLSAQIAGFY